MAKHIFRREDEERTELLGHDELFVQKGKGSDTYYNAWLHDSEIECCPRCGSDAVKTQDLFSKTYLDLVSDGQRKKVIQLEYEFYKYRCLDKDCRHVFSKPVGFASKRDNVTFRLENEIAQQVLNGASYAQIANRLSGSISRQAIGQIFNRWVRKKEARRKTTMLPSRLAILSGKTDKDQYTIFLNVDHGIRVYDIVYGVSSADIAAVLLKDGVPNVQVVLSDCNPIVVDAIRGYLPNALHIIPVEYWFSLVYAAFIAENRKAVIQCILNGTPIKSLKDAKGNKMLDGYLKDEVAKIDPIFSEVYNNASGYVHLSEKAFYQTVDFCDNYEIGIQIGQPLPEKRNAPLLEAATAYIHFVNLHFKMLQAVVESKQRFDASQTENESQEV